MEKAWKTRPLFDVVRKGGLEPPRPCGRQPLKLVRIYVTICTTTIYK